jgi:hypothetical protein
MGDHAAEIEGLYRRCALLRQRFQDAALRSVPVPKVVEQAGRLGLPVTQELAQVSEGDLSFAFDLSVYTAPPGRSRAIDRVARGQRAAQGEAALVLSALTSAWFSVFRVLGPHPEAGLLLEDVLLGGQVWALDEALAESAAPGTILASRIGRVRGFAVTCGVVAVLDEAMLAGFRGVLSAADVPVGDMVADPRFATLIYQRALGFHIEDALGLP